MISEAMGEGKGNLRGGRADTEHSGEGRSVRGLVVLPAYNEEKTLGEVLSRLGESFPSFDRLVVDDGSADGTADVARAATVPRS